MASITIKDLPDELHRKLKEEAKKNERSLNGEVLFRLRLSTVIKPERDERDVEALLASIDRVRNSHDVQYDAELHARALSEGRP